VKPPSALPAKPLASSAGEAGANVQAILESPAYRFCHDPAYPWTDAEARWCAAVGDRNERCSALPRACQGEMTHARGSRHRGWGEGREYDDEPFTLRLPNVGPIGSVVLWAMLAVVVGVVARAVWRRSLASRRNGGASRQSSDPADGLDAALGKSAVEIDVERLLERARRAAAMGLFGDAIAHAYAALLRQLEGERLLRVDPWRTNGDYLRELSPRPEIRLPLGRVVRSVEGVQFGREAPSRERFESVLEQVTVLLWASAARMARGAGLASTTAILCLALALASCWGAHLRGAEEDSPSGTSAVLELARRSGLEPRLRMRSLSKVVDSDQIVLLPGAEVNQEQWPVLLDWVGQGGVLIVTNRDGWLSTWPGLNFSCGAAAPINLTLGDDARDWGPLSIAVPGGNELEIPPGAPSHGVLLRRDKSVYAVRFDYGAGALIALADGHLFTNASLAMADNAAFLVSLLEYRRDKKKIDFVGELTGSGAKTPLSSVRRGKLAPVLLQLGLCLILFFLYKGVAFGSLVDPPRERRRSFAEHARALGLLYAKAGAAGHARSIYGAYVLERLRDNALFRDQKGIGALAEVVAARSGQPLGKVTQMLVEAQEPRSDDPKDKGSHEDLDLIRSLSRLLRQSKGGPK